MELKMWFISEELSSHYRDSRREAITDPVWPGSGGCNLANLRDLESIYVGESSGEPSREEYCFKGYCHCGSFVFSVHIPDIQHFTLCNCSLCYKAGLRMIACPIQGFTLTKGSLRDLTRYRCGVDSSHHFCPTCGVTLIVLSSSFFSTIYVNFGVLHHNRVDLWEVPGFGYPSMRRLDGYTEPSAAHLPDPIWQGPDSSKMHQGSCHCGKILVKLRTGRWIDEYNIPVECNCSMCERVCPVWITGCHAQATIQRGTSRRPAGATGRCYYAPQGTRGRLLWIFCDVCGVFVALAEAKDMKEWRRMLEAEPEQSQFLGQIGGPYPKSINLRIFMDIDVDTLPTVRQNGRGRAPEYLPPA
ncbi:hypothetical protein MAPG_00551 [Magnaporthiopsis poae ATCC 64411]|uniref:CENP-V/GFA domain-containing protein n=1 Tax=Magnaporthiopsis poae (strain ATCC 64411 / 73-15) TaxID=644358 RepID=A0A0C4DLB0_MAGP6|nr:hypothetical protein MAPG_00551 [Magnaporthiopsis poae ATCC 64411]